MPLGPSDVASLAAWDAVETAARLRGGEVSAAEVLEAALARLEDAAHLGAVVTTAAARARAQAGALTPGPLSGVPTLLKDLAQLEAVETTWGSRGAVGLVSSRSDPFVRRFEATGLVTLGKSATPELGLAATTEPLGRPPCRNPWSPGRSAGGSSGGAAALVAAGVVPLAHGTDGAGSIRVPASACGLVGLKPSRRRMDVAGSSLLPVNIAVDGVLTRTVRDTVAFHQALEASRPRGAPALTPVGAAPARALRVGVYVESPLGTPVHPDHREAALAAGRLCASLGHQVDEARCPFESRDLVDFFAFWGLVAWGEVALARVVLHRSFDRSRLEPWSRDLAATFGARPGSILAATWRLRSCAGRYARALAPWDVLVSPTVSHPPPALGHFGAELPFSTVLERLITYLPFTPLVNAAGAPALSLPWGLGAEGLPVGVQLAAAPGADHLVLELGLALEAARPWTLVAPRDRWAVPRAG
jgi:amidase